MSMMRFNHGKPKLHLVTLDFVECCSKPSLIHDVAYVLEFGAKKYDEHNWRKGGSWTSTWSSGARHWVKYYTGETHDLESGLSHLSHLGCNLMFLLEFQRRGLGTDDRHVLGDDYWGVNADAVASYLWHWRDGGPVEDLTTVIGYLSELYESRPVSERLFREGTSEYAFIPARAEVVA